jgi:hypothetical protein
MAKVQKTYTCFLGEMENEIENYDGSMRSDFEGTPQRSTGRN